MPAADSAATLRILVALPALARSFPGQAPAGVVDEAAELATYGDHYAVIVHLNDVFSIPRTLMGHGPRAAHNDSTEVTPR